MSAHAHHFGNVAETVGWTPLVILGRMSEGLPGTVAVKLESRNPGGSVKDRIGKAMIDDAEARGLITPGQSTIVEPTSGNTGIALAMIGVSRGYRVVLTMPESMSVERRKMLASYGAELVLTPKETGMKGAVAEAERIVAETPGAWMPMQFANPANPAVHYTTTGPEVVRSVGDAELGAFVAGVGTGGTVTGVGRYLREHVPSAKVFAVEPALSPIISQTRAGQEIAPAPHTIQGIGANFIPAILDVDLPDDVITMDAETAIATARRLAAEEGISGGISSGANVAAALLVAAQEQMAGKLIVTVVCDTGERYLSTPLWDL